MPAPHPATLKAELRRTLHIDRVLTTVQLERRGLLQAATWLALPHLTLTCRTRVTQSDSAVDLTFVAVDGAWLTRPARDLMHWVGLAEARARLDAVQGDPSARRWQHVDLAGSRKSHLPDAEMLAVDLAQDDAVEFDAGYAPTRIQQKIAAAGQAGYHRLIWATSIHNRTRSVPRLAQTLFDQGGVSGLHGLTVLFVDFWTPGNPYRDRPRCHKLGHQTLTFKEAEVRSRGRGGRGSAAAHRPDLW